MQKLASAGHSFLSNASRPLRLKLKSLSTGKDHEHDVLGLDDVLSLSGLPDDVLLLILSFLGARAVLICKGVSRFFRDLITTDMLLTYRIELAINGMINGPPSSGLTIPERLDKLRQYSERFCTGSFTRNIEMRLGRFGLGEMTHLMTPWNLRVPQPDSFGGTVCFELGGQASPGRERSLMVYAPPSFVEGTPARRWTIPLPSNGKHILAVDVTQDLVVALGPVAGNPRKAEISLLTLESGGSVIHPLAEQPAWEIWVEGRLSNERVTTQVVGPYLAWKTPYRGSDSVLGEDHLEVRNWKTGCKVWEDYMQYVASYTLIDTSYLAVVFISSGDLNPANLHGRSPDAIGIYRIRNERGLSVGRVATLQLPREVEVSTILNSSVPASPNPPPSAPFWPDPEQRVVVLRLRVSYSPPPSVMMRVLRPTHHDTPRWDGPWYGALLVIPCTTFRRHTRPVGTTSTPTPIPWEGWGIQGSVLIRDESLTDTFLPREHYWQPPQFVFPFGSRLTFFSRSSSPDGGPRLITLDANPLAKLHPPNPGCTMLDTFAGVEKTDEPGVFSNLKTTHPRVYYIGPPFTDVQHALAITQNASGYAVLTHRGDPESDQTLEGVHAFAVS